MWKRGTTPKRRDLALQWAGDARATRGALCPCVLLFVLCPLALGTLAAFSPGDQELSPSAGRRVDAPRSIQAAPAITQVDIRGTSREAIVRVEGDGHLTAHPFRLHGPERLVLDFSGARLALAGPSIQGARGPVRGVRVGQFKPDVARVVIDLELAAPYLLQSEGKSVTVSFALATEALATEPTASPTGFKPARPLVPVHRTEASPPAPLSPGAEGAGEMLRPELGRELRGALSSPVPPGAKVEPLQNAFADGMLTFHAQNQTLRSALEQIGDKTQIAILLSEQLGDERVSLAFRQERLDEALRQLLKGYDVLFFYGVDKEKKGAASLRAVWVYPATQGPGRDLSMLGSWKAGTKEVDRKEVAPTPGAGAKAIEAPAGREPRAGQSANPEVGAPRDQRKDQRDEARTQAYYKALISGADLPEQTLIDLVLNNKSTNVRLLALQALPVEPRLRWVAERAQYDSGPVGEVARNILQKLDAVKAPPSLFGTKQNEPQEK